jgi:hypothetical protein
VTEATLREPVEVAMRAVHHVRDVLAIADATARDASARGVAMTLARALEVLLLASHGQWALGAGRGGRAAAAVRRLARSGVDLVAEAPAEETALLAGE